LDEIKEKIDFFLDPSRVLGQKSCQKNGHFLLSHPQKPIFHKNFDVFFSKFPNTHVGKTLFVDDKSIFNDSCSAIFWNHLRVRIVMGIICFPPFFLTWSHFTCLGLTYVKHNPFETIRSIS